MVQKRSGNENQAWGSKGFLGVLHRMVDVEAGTAKRNTGIDVVSVVSL